MDPLTQIKSEMTQIRALAHSSLALPVDGDDSSMELDALVRTIARLHETARELSCETEDPQILNAIQDLNQTINRLERQVRSQQGLLE